MDATADDRCRARSKRTGERCRLRPLAGQAVCASHGGAAPRAARNARRRLLEAWARRAAWLVGVGPAPSPEDVALARKLDRLRAEPPRWWLRVDPQARYRRRGG